MALSKNNLENDLKDFLSLAVKLKSSNKHLYESYKNRMIGALEVQNLNVPGGKNEKTSN